MPPGFDLDGVRALADPLVPRADLIAAGRHVVKGEACRRRRNAEEAVVEDHDARRHVRVDVAVDLDQTRVRKPAAAGFAARVAAEVEVGAARQREDVVEERIGVREVDGRARVIATTRGTKASSFWVMVTCIVDRFAAARRVFQKDDDVGDLGGLRAAAG